MSAESSFARIAALLADSQSLAAGYASHIQLIIERERADHAAEIERLDQETTFANAQHDAMVQFSAKRRDEIVASIGFRRSQAIGSFGAMIARLEALHDRIVAGERVMPAAIEEPYTANTPDTDDNDPVKPWVADGDGDDPPIPLFLTNNRKADKEIEDIARAA